MIVVNDQIEDIRINFVSGGGEMGRLIGNFDWGSTSLGPIDTWNQSLKTSVNLILNSTQPMWIGWGPENIFIYNDPYLQVLGMAKHPWALGKPAQVVWSEVWDFCGPLSDKVYKEGKASFVNNVPLFMYRGDFLEEVFYSFSYSPIYDETGSVSGLFCPNTETTAKMLNERRLKTLSELSATALVEKTSGSALQVAMVTIGKNREDIPFAALYIIDAPGQKALFNTSTGLNNGSVPHPGLNNGCIPSFIDLDQPGSPSIERTIAEVIRSGRQQVIDIQGIEGLPPGLANQPVTDAIVLPITVSAALPTGGAIIAGINPTRKLDEEYRTFFELVAGQVSTAYQNAIATENDRRRAEMLAEINEAKTTFFSNISHEFRTPLTLMLGPLEELLNRPENTFSTQDRQQIEVTHRNAMRLLKLVNSLLDFSRLESGHPEIQFEQLDLATFTTDLAGTFRSIIEQAGLKYIVSCKNITRPVYADKVMWEKIVLNLLSNAFKYTLTGSITVQLSSDATNVQLTIKDTGVGIPEKELPHMFERFHRVKNTAGRTFEGTGIGLSLVHELVTLHGGKIRVESREHKGSTFTVTIPLGNLHLPAKQITTQPTNAHTQLAKSFINEASSLLSHTHPSPLTTHRSFAPVHQSSVPEDQPSILVVDDNADMLAYISRLLHNDYRVFTASNGKEALARIHDAAPDLVLSDIMMPIMDGIQLLAAIKNNNATRNLPVILLSARAGEESRLEGYHIGADDYLVKPFSSKELQARIKAQLKQVIIRKQIEDSEQRLEGVVAERTKELVQMNKELESFNYIASHDLQEPLRKIQTFTDLLQRGANDEKFTATYLEKIKAAAQRMSNLIHSVLTFSKLSSTDILFCPTDLNTILENVRSDFEVLIEERDAIVTSTPLPTIRAIPLQMNQLFSNLISNALKFSKDRPVIRVTGSVIGTTAILTFSDNGIGFEPQYREKVFDLFQRLHGPSEYTGTGVGLSICKKIVLRHKGLITAESNPNQGATFTIQLPVE